MNEAQKDYVEMLATKYGRDKKICLELAQLMFDNPKILNKEVAE